MASNYTSNYNLCQWAAGDKVLRTEFNADNAKIDSAIKAVDRKADGKASTSAVNGLSSAVDSLSAQVAGHAGTLEHKGNCQIQLSSFTGNGAQSRTHTFAHKPAAVIILSDMSLVAVQGCPRAIHTLGGGNTYVPYTAWSGNSVTLSAIDPGTSDIARVVANTANRTYYMIALFDLAE